MLDRLNESLWTNSTGNRFASLWYAIIDPESGELQYAAAGEIHALVYDALKLESLTDGNPTLGLDPDHRYRQVSGSIDAGQSLAIFTRSKLTALDEQRGDPDECRVVGALQTLENATAEERVNAAAAELENGCEHERTIVVVRRIF